MLTLAAGWYLGKVLVRVFGRRAARQLQRPSVSRTVLRGVRTGVFLLAASVAASFLGLGLGTSCSRDGWASHVCPSRSGRDTRGLTSSRRVLRRMREVTAADGETLYVDEAEGEIGSDAPFYAVYATPERERRWGWFCSNCESLDNAMDTMGRIKCNDCGNLRKPEGWDAAHE